MPKANFTQADVRRSIKAMQECGLTIQACEIEDGSFRVITEQSPAFNANQNEKLKDWNDE